MIIRIGELKKFMNIPIRNFEDISRCKADLLRVFNSDMYINEKGYMQKLIDLLYKLGYYENNESIFLTREKS